MTQNSKAKPNMNRQAVYTGRRLLIGGGIAHSFLLLPDRTKLLFKSTRGVRIGWTYECGEAEIARRPKQVEREHEENLEWITADALVDAHNAEKRAQAKYAAKSGERIKAAVEALRPLLRATSYYDRKALVEYLLEKAR